MLVVTEGPLVAECAEDSEVLGYDVSGTSLVFLFVCMSDIVCSGRSRFRSEAR